MLPEPGDSRKAMGPSGRRADRPAAAGAFGAARGAGATLARHRLRRMGAGAGDCPGRTVASGAHVGVASDAPRRPPRPSFGRMFALRLASEAAGQVGVFGQVFGDTWRVAGLGADLPLATRITSVALDRALYTLSSTIVTIAGVIALAFVLPLPGKIALYAKIFGFVLVAIVSLAVIAVRRRWRLISGPAAALGRIGRIRPWVESKREAIQSVEDRLLDFFHYSPAHVSEEPGAPNGWAGRPRCWKSI